jgi:para-nitrobenzyl esterase
MKQAYILFCLVFLAASATPLKAQYSCGNGRYYNQIFAETTTTVPYGEAPLYNGDDTVLLMDVYQPTGDNFAHRPLMIFAFGGSFTSGVRQSPDLITLCTYFSERGYVCVSIDYRLGMPDGSDSSELQAVFRGVQDMKAAVRFFYKDAWTVNQYRIDTNEIYIGGSSAGAFIALNYAYFKMDTFSKPPPSFAAPALIAIGGVDGNSGSPGYSQKVKGVIDLSGAIADTVWIMPGDPMLVGEHGTMDSTVTCWFDSTFASTHTRSALFGGGDIKNRMSHITFNDSMYLFYGAGHVPFILPFNASIQAILNVPLYMDTTEWLIRDFLYKNVICDSTIAGISDPGGKLSITIYPNPSNSNIAIYSGQPEDMDVAVVNTMGQVMRRDMLAANSTLTLRKDDLGAGIYIVEFLGRGTNDVLKTEKIVFY